MSKSIIYLVVIVVAAFAVGGAYHYLKGEPPPPITAPAAEVQSVPPVPVIVAPKPDHGNFQKRFQPTMPPANGGSK